MPKTQPFNQRVQEVQEQTGSLLCVGLDPDPDRMPAHLPKDVGGVREFCLDIIRATREYVCAYKFNSAFFEALGGQGLDLLHELRQSLPEPILASRSMMSSAAISATQPDTMPGQRFNPWGWMRSP
ncbi:MAG: hypothetical protein P8Y60_19000 [Calditrichota bacterium]